MNILDEIFAQKRASQAEKHARVPLRDLQARQVEPPAGFRRALENANRPISLIAEVKKASPVKGVLREDFDPVQIANAYRLAGVQAMSVLTCAEFFQGSQGNLIAAKRAASVPVIRKDFTVSEYDIWEAKAMGADAILLIAYGLDDAELKGLRELAEGLGFDALVEVHDAQEMGRALDSGATFVGVNNRDLRTFETRIETLEELAPKVPSHVHLVAESAIRNAADVARVQAAGARSVLIGTAFVKAADPGAAVIEVMGW
ncbi:MAG: indole-3-glycerol phosphate synthase TrpC [Chthonomonas sp.]|nr:indole-3-glycerol phosphate synthase TrpC [Chthonomonas sp.]